MQTPAMNALDTSIGHGSLCEQPPPRPVHRGRRYLVFTLIAALTYGVGRWLYSGWSSIGD